jgi:flagellar motor switch protein FliN/FliY
VTRVSSGPENESCSEFLVEEIGLHVWIESARADPGLSDEGQVVEFARTFKSLLSAAVSLTLQADDPKHSPAPANTDAIRLRLSHSNGDAWDLCVSFERGLAPALEALLRRSTPIQDSQRQPAALDVLMNAELPVSVRIGRTQMPLSEALAIRDGSVITLKESDSELVDLMLGATVIARGELVLVDGAFGLRIAEIAAQNGPAFWNALSVPQRNAAEVSHALAR